MRTYFKIVSYACRFFAAFFAWAALKSAYCGDFKSEIITFLFFGWSIYGCLLTQCELKKVELEMLAEEGEG